MRASTTFKWYSAFVMKEIQGLAAKMTWLNRKWWDCSMMAHSFLGPAKCIHDIPWIVWPFYARKLVVNLVDIWKVTSWKGTLNEEVSRRFFLLTDMFFNVHPISEAFCVKFTSCFTIAKWSKVVKTTKQIWLLNICMDTCGYIPFPFQPRKNDSYRSKWRVFGRSKKAQHRPDKQVHRSSGKTTYQSSWDFKLRMFLCRCHVKELRITVFFCCCLTFITTRIWLRPNSSIHKTNNIARFYLKTYMPRPKHLDWFKSHPNKY